MLMYCRRGARHRSCDESRKPRQLSVQHTLCWVKRNCKGQNWELLNNLLSGRWGNGYKYANRGKNMSRQTRNENFYFGTEQQEVVKYLSLWLSVLLDFHALRLFHLIFSSLMGKKWVLQYCNSIIEARHIAEALPLFSGLTRAWSARRERICAFKWTFWKCCPHMNTNLTSNVQVSLKKGGSWSVKMFSPAAWSQGAEKQGWTKLAYVGWVHNVNLQRGLFSFIHWLDVRSCKDIKESKL